MVDPGKRNEPQRTQRAEKIWNPGSLRKKIKPLMMSADKRVESSRYENLICDEPVFLRSKDEDAIRRCFMAENPQAPVLSLLQSAFLTSICG